jgi:multicomponent Na+:H+ antiporter subunit E
MSRVDPRSLLVRTAGYFVIWVIMAGTQPADLAAGLVAAGVAAAISLQLLPLGKGRVRPLLLARLALRFLRQSVVAGVDVAWRALHPRMPLRPGFITYDAQSSDGVSLSAFCTMTSLLPGTLPVGQNDNGRLVVHCLDTSQPVAAQLRQEETLFARAIGGVGRNE